MANLHKRVGHIAVPYKHYILVWGGFMSNESDEEVYSPTDHIWFYNCTTESWTLGQTKGYLPFRNSGATGVVCDDYLYIYGGVEELTEELWRYSSELHRLNLRTLTWVNLSPAGIPPQGCDKGVGWVYNDKIYFFGGYGQRSRQVLNGYSFDTDTSNLQGHRGWHNQLTIYDPTINSWVNPKTNGHPPKPRAAHAVDLRDGKAYIFGGRLAAGRSNDLFILELSTLTWKQTSLKTGVREVPEGRSWHSFNFISDSHAIVYGGLNQQGFPCSDWWECMVEGEVVNWIQRGKMNKALVWHKAAFSSLTKELIIIGGVTCSPYIMREENHVDKLLIMQWSPVSLFRLCLNEVIKQELWPDSNLPKCLLDIVIARASGSNSKAKSTNFQTSFSI